MLNAAFNKTEVHRLYSSLADVGDASPCVSAGDPDERLRRDASDFLAERNHEGLVFHFHSLRHTSGALLALAGIPPKVVQAVMRHSTINLKMDT
jgi:integrase